MTTSPLVGKTVFRLYKRKTVFQMANRRSALRYPLTVVFGSEARVSILRELSLHGGALSAPQLVARTSFAQSTIREAIEACVYSGVVVTSGAGKAMLYRLDQKHWAFAEFRNLFAREHSRYDDIIDSIRSVGIGFGDAIHAIWLFGSVARGTDSFSSDIDLAVIHGQKARPGLIELFGDRIRRFEEEYGFHTSITLLAAEDLPSLLRNENPLMLDLMADARTIIGPGPAEMHLLGRSQEVSIR